MGPVEQSRVVKNFHDIVHNKVNKLKIELPEPIKLSVDAFLKAIDWVLFAPLLRLLYMAVFGRPLFFGLQISAAASVRGLGAKSIEDMVL